MSDSGSKDLLGKYRPYFAGIIGTLFISYLLYNDFFNKAPETRYYTYGIPIERELSHANKIEFVKNFIKKVQNGNLKEKILSTTKNISLKNLEKGLSLSWKSKSFYSTKGSTKTVYIECTYVTENLKLNPEIIARACKKYIESALIKT